LETIAWSCGLAVRYAPLAGCDARIVGKGDRGVLTVNSAQSPARRRFSLAHELGHWQLHRGRLMLCRAEEIEGSVAEARGLELDADQYAAALLMPRYLFVPSAAGLKGKPPWTMVDALSAQFQTSLLATALRMITLDIWPGWLVCHTRNGRPFAFKAPSVDDGGRPPIEVDHRSAAFDMVHSSAAGVRSNQVPGDVWLGGAQRRLAVEHCRAYPPDRVLTFVRLL
jgi:hypothetical protein